MREVPPTRARVLDTLRLRDWTPDAHYVGPVHVVWWGCGIGRVCERMSARGREALAAQQLSPSGSDRSSSPPSRSSGIVLEPESPVRRRASLSLLDAIFRLDSPVSSRSASKSPSPLGQRSSFSGDRCVSPLTNAVDACGKSCSAAASGRTGYNWLVSRINSGEAVSLLSLSGNSAVALTPAKVNTVITYTVVSVAARDPRIRSCLCSPSSRRRVHISAHKESFFTPPGDSATRCRSRALT